MNIVKPDVEFIYGPESESKMKKVLEKIIRKCYKSENKITEDDSSAEDLIQKVFVRQHYAMLEHISFTYAVTCDRGVSHEIVRHRLASYAQESTRYCNYANDKFSGSINVIDLATGFEYNFNSETDVEKYEEWKAAMLDAEKHYMKLIELGAAPQEARSVLPNSLKTEIVITMNIREWLHFLNLRWKGTTGAPHPQMKEVAKMIRDDLIERYPFVMGKCAQLI